MDFRTQAGLATLVLQHPRKKRWIAEGQLEGWLRGKTLFSEALYLVLSTHTTAWNSALRNPTYVLFDLHGHPHTYAARSQARNKNKTVKISPQVW